MRTQWTAEREEALRRLWANGASATAIGIELHMSRSAILGKVHRLKLGGGQLHYRATPPRRRADIDAGIRN